MTDIAVVGAGIVGASAALAAAGAGARVTLVDAGFKGQATAAGAGVVTPMSPQPRTEEWYALGFAGAESYSTLIDDVFEGTPPPRAFRAVGSLLVGRDDDMDRFDEIARRHERLSAKFGTPCLGDLRHLDAGEPPRLFPGLDPALRGIHMTGVVRIDGAELSREITATAVARGVELRTGTAELTVSGAEVTGVRVDGVSIGADSVVLATGAWPIALSTGEDLPGVPVSPQRGQIAHLRWPVGQADGPLVASLDSRYMVAFPGDRLVVGATVENASGFDDSVTAGGVAEILGEALRLAPGLHPAPVTEVRTGFRPVSPDGLPLVGAHPSLDGLFLATGLGSNGLLLGPHLGACAADLALGREPAGDLALLSPARFRADHTRPDRSRSNV